ncbi:basic secretory protein-like protein [Stenotrophomonas rhizophila]|uniref:basic secretory protein-like protein n=1 Tax=Stenotrophomonas rhizophila TaxID=216778 RepID=UPI001AEBAF5C|nr:basic secretory protein-like protein [Stenotrophomonas rhizophila]
MRLRRCLIVPAVAATLAFPAAHAAEIQQTRDGVTLTYQDQSGSTVAAVRDRIIATFFATYPRERRDYHPAAPSSVRIVMDPSYDGVAYVGEKEKSATITINPRWLEKHPNDTDLVTHEAMHIVQGYPGYASEQAPSWLVEGIADYARDHYGVDNAAGGWALPSQVKPEHKVDTGYRVTGAFLKWSEAGHPGLVKALDAALRKGTYTPALWKAHTGEDLAALWEAYVAQQGNGARGA